MIYSINGVLLEKNEDFVVIEVGGIGYKLNVSKTTLHDCADVLKTQKFYTYMHIREDLLDLFGFTKKSEQECFKLLISVSGVGPKVACAILSEYDVESLYRIISSGDFHSLTKCSGIGAKTAQRMILELKDKVVNLSSHLFLEDSKLGNINKPIRTIDEDALNALISLGYSKLEATNAIKNVDNKSDTNQIIKECLKILSGKVK